LSGVESTSNTDWTATVLALSAIGGLVITLVLHLLSARKDRDIQFNEMLNRFATQLSDIKLRETNLKDIDSALRYQRDYVRTLDRLAYLKKLGKIDDKMIDFFEGSFIFAYTLIEWERQLFPPTDDDDSFWKHAKWWINEKKIKKGSFNGLPPQLYEMYKKTKDGHVLVFKDGESVFIHKDNLKQSKSDNQ
jgi:hypothetical protein